MKKTHVPASIVQRSRSKGEREAALWRHAVGAHQRLSFLNEASRLLSQSLDLPKVISTLTGLAVPKIAQWCLVDLLDENGKLELVGAADVDPRKIPLLREMRRRFPPDPDSHPIHRVVRTGEPRLSTGADPRFYRPGGSASRRRTMVKRLQGGPFVCVPLKADGRVIGALTFGRARGAHPLNAADRQLAEELGLRAGAALVNSRLYERARLADEFLTRALSATRMVAWNWDLRTGRVDRSANAVDIYGVAPDVTLGQGLHLELVHHDDRARYEAAVRGAVDRREPYVSRFRIVRHDGVILHMEDHGSVLCDDSGSPVRVCGVVMDVTATKAAEDVLRESEKTQREFVASVSHEFRTPVAAIRGCADSLLSGAGESDADRKRFLHIIRSHTDRLGGLVEDVLMLSGLDSDKELDCEPVDLGRLVADQLRGASDGRPAPSSVLNRVPRESWVAADSRYLAVALESLVKNAVRFSAPGTPVHIESRRRGGNIRLTVRDKGIGIKPEHLRRVFDRFYRVNPGASDGHVGLGLHIAKKIVEAHGGRIWAESVPGRGSSFHILLRALAVPAVKSKTRSLNDEAHSSAGIIAGRRRRAGTRQELEGYRGAQLH